MTLDTEFIMKLHVNCEPDLEVKSDGSGYLRVIPIIGGYVEGKVNGRVVPGGADWNTTRENGIAHVFAKYLIKTEDGEYIAVENEGKIRFDEASVIKTTPRFQANDTGNYAWLNVGVYVASLDSGKEPGQVEITVYKMV
ncbi:MAG: DUF3237 domain-containing protein [Mobilitalea sp.]